MAQTDPKQGGIGEMARTDPNQGGIDEMARTDPDQECCGSEGPHTFLSLYY